MRRQIGGIIVATALATGACSGQSLEETLEGTANLNESGSEAQASDLFEPVSAEDLQEVRSKYWSWRGTEDNPEKPSLWYLAVDASGGIEKEVGSGYIHKATFFGEDNKFYAIMAVDWAQPESRESYADNLICLIAVDPQTNMGNAGFLTLWPTRNGERLPGYAGQGYAFTIETVESILEGERDLLALVTQMRSETPLEMDEFRKFAYRSTLELERATSENRTLSLR